MMLTRPLCHQPLGARRELLRILRDHEPHAVMLPEPAAEASATQMGADVRDLAKVRELFGVDDRTMAADLAAGDLEADHADQLALPVERSRPARRSRSTRGHGTRDPAPARTQASNVRATRARPPSSRASAGDLAAAVAVEHHVSREERLELGEIALLRPRRRIARASGRAARARSRSGSALLDARRARTAS